VIIAVTLTRSNHPGKYTITFAHQAAPVQNLINTNKTLTVSGPNSITYLNRTPIFEWWVGGEVQILERTP